MKKYVLPFLLVVLSFCLSAPAHAQAQVVQCGAPIDSELGTETADYCNIYDRQFAYEKKRKHFRELIDQRRENYEAPRKRAVEAYGRNVEGRHYPKGEEDPGE